MYELIKLGIKCLNVRYNINYNWIKIKINIKWSFDIKFIRLKLKSFKF